jgi:hypothetical protein
MVQRMAQRSLMARSNLLLISEGGTLLSFEAGCDHTSLARTNAKGSQPKQFLA